MSNLTNKIKKKIIVLCLIYLIFSIVISVFYLYNLDDNKLYFSVLFFITVVLNLLTLNVYGEKKLKVKLLFSSIFPFLLFLIFSFFLSNSTYSNYKILLIIPVCFSLYQVLKNVRFGKVND